MARSRRRRPTIQPFHCSSNNGSKKAARKQLKWPFCHHGTAGVQGAAILTSPSLTSQRDLFSASHHFFLRCLDRVVNAKRAVRELAAAFPGRARAARGSGRRGVPRILLVAGARPRPPARNTRFAFEVSGPGQRIHHVSGLGDLTRISERLAAARFGVSPTMPRSCASPRADHVADNYQPCRPTLAGELPFAGMT